MGKLRWYKRNPDAALSGMMELNLEQRGAYTTVLDLIYSRDGQIADDDRFIAGWLRVDVRIWKRLRKELVGLGKLYIKDGFLRNLRADEEILRGLDRLASCQDAGRASARKRELQSNKINNIPPTNAQQPFQPIRIRKKEDTVLPSGNTDATASPIYSNSRHELWGEGPAILVSLGLPDQKTRTQIGRWLKTTKDDCQAVLSAIQRARDANVFDPVPWVTKALSDGPPRNGAPPKSAVSEKWRGAYDKLKSAVDELDFGQAGSGDTLRVLPALGSG